MTKIGLKLIIILLIIQAKAFAQSEDLLGVRFGVNVSPSINWLGSDDARVESSNASLGFKFGFNGEYVFAKNYSICAGLGLGISQGGKLRYTNGGNILPKSPLPNIDEDIKRDLPIGTKINYKLNYLELPVSLKFRTKEYGYVKYYAELPIFTITSRASAKASIDGVNLDVNKQNIKEDISLLGAMWGLGGGFEYNLSEDNSIVMGAYYHQGFFDITNKNDYNDKVTNRVIAVRLGFNF